ncbi:MAG TPA: hypothetical protein VK781_13785 [Solirubrobacteraceae bacterium]|nr:hypothetical protein [Solirubrobacteraceae bacterium]
MGALPCLLAWSAREFEVRSGCPVEVHYSRAHTGVHYPSNVVVGVGIGSGLLAAHSG